MAIRFKCNDLLFRDGTRSRGMRFVSDLARTWRYPPKTFSSVYIRAAPLIVKKIAILIQTTTQSFSWMTMIQLSLLQLFHMASVSGAWGARFVAAHVWTSCSTDAYDVKQVLKTFKSASMLLLVQKEQHKQSFQPHIIISVLQTFK